MDGTLVDTEGLWWEAVEQVAGRPLTEADRPDVLGRPVEHTAAWLAAATDGNTSAPTAGPAAAPAAELAAEPTAELAAEPTAGPAAAPAVEPTVEPTA
ncbi:hypothetical protein ACFV3S_38055, partial [Streptomyces sp. NPDC059749]